MADTALGELAKDCLDIGVFTNQLEQMLDFWQQEAGLEFDHMLPVGGGVRQHRHDLQGSVFKLNHSRAELAALDASPGGYQRILIASEQSISPYHLTDPDGNRVTVVPSGYRGVSQWAIEVATGSVAEFEAFYVAGLGLPRVSPSELDAQNACAVRCGRSLILGVVNPELASLTLAQSQAASADMRSLGIRYTTIQVRSVDSVFAQVVANGGLAGSEPRTLGTTARIAFVRDQRGNWLELSQRASLTGSLEPA